MIVGTTLFKLDGNPYYSSEFARQGLAATFSIEVTNASGTPTLSVTIEHRNAEDTTWASAQVFGSITSTGLATQDASGLKEVLRLKFVFTGGSSASAVHFLLPAPAWRPY